MRLILLTLVLCTNTLSADPSRTNEHEGMNDSRPGQKAAKRQRTFYPLRLLRRLGNAESELGLRLSSWGIQREVEAVNSGALRCPSHSTGTSTSMSQRSFGDTSQ
jgi:hypothetical protein